MTVVGVMAGAAIAASRPIRGWLSVVIVPTLGVVGGVLNGLAVRDPLVAGGHVGHRAPIYLEWCGASGLGPFLGILAKSALAGRLVAAAVIRVGIGRPPPKWVRRATAPPEFNLMSRTSQFPIGSSRYSKSAHLGAAATRVDSRIRSSGVRARLLQRAHMAEHWG